MPTATPTLAELATLAHSRRCSVLALDDGPLLVDDHDRPMPFLGVRFGPEVHAVAARVGTHASAAPIVAVDRVGDAVVYDPTTDRLHDEHLTGVALDPPRRTLGLATRPCRRPVWALRNLVWLDRVLGATLDAALGDPPRWPTLCRLHPLHRPGPPESPEGIAHRCRWSPDDWHTLRADVIDGTVRWVPISPALAAWFDAGSFARHGFASLPDHDVVLADLHELLRPADLERVVAALARP